MADTRKAIIKAVRAGETSRSIAKRLGVTYRRVNQIRSEEGISSPRGKPRCRAWTPKERRQIERECKKRRELMEQLKDYSLEAIGRRWGISASTVQSIYGGGYFSWPLEKKG
jgi:transposase-like protein